jgi:hypothetical protein
MVPIRARCGLSRRSRICPSLRPCFGLFGVDHVALDKRQPILGQANRGPRKFAIAAVRGRTHLTNHTPDGMRNAAALEPEFGTRSPTEVERPADRLVSSQRSQGGALRIRSRQDGRHEVYRQTSRAGFPQVARPR